MVNWRGVPLRRIWGERRLFFSVVLSQVRCRRHPAPSSSYESDARMITKRERETLADSRATPKSHLRTCCGSLRHPKHVMELSSFLPRTQDSGCSTALLAHTCRVPPPICDPPRAPLASRQVDGSPVEGRQSGTTPRICCPPQAPGGWCPKHLSEKTLGRRNAPEQGFEAHGGTNQGSNPTPLGRSLQSAQQRRSASPRRDEK